MALIKTSKGLKQIFDKPLIWQALLSKYFPTRVQNPDYVQSPKLLFRSYKAEQQLEQVRSQLQALQIEQARRKESYYSWPRH
ncbi:MAG: hypothetical protein JSR17_07030 [Proteobacteria bacterium]|nr:hypothetical protein [Pseudomonadota bacterium]